jgi:hypothetical protein
MQVPKKPATVVAISLPIAIAIAIPALLSTATAHAEESGDLHGNIFDYHSAYLGDDRGANISR